MTDGLGRGERPAKRQRQVQIQTKRSLVFSRCSSISAFSLFQGWLMVFLPPTRAAASGQRPAISNVLTNKIVHISCACHDAKIITSYFSFYIFLAVLAK